MGEECYLQTDSAFEETTLSHVHNGSLCILGAVGVHTWNGESYPPAARS